jgi:uncharacterized OB-fold protein
MAANWKCEECGCITFGASGYCMDCGSSDLREMTPEEERASMEAAGMILED